MVLLSKSGLLSQKANIPAVYTNVYTRQIA
jgi:hypothetical protein